MELSRVEVVYALPHEQVVLALEVTRAASVREVIEKSGLLARFPEIDLARNRVGIFGKLCNPDDPVHDGDRVEIYRPLSADPKEQRRRRAVSRPSSSRRG